MRLALLTGVGREGQVGEAVAARLSADGFHLIVVDRTVRNVEERAAALGSAGHVATPYGCDLSDSAAVDRLFQLITDEHGGDLDALVHMAGGFAVTGPVAQTEIADWEHQLAINLRTAFLVCRRGIPMLRSRSGSAVFFSSDTVVTGAKLSGMSPYNVAKMGVIALALTAAEEERSSHVRVNVVAPSAVRTAANTTAMSSRVRLVEREDVAATVAFLCSDAARAITGQVLRLTPW